MKPAPVVLLRCAEATLRSLPLFADVPRAVVERLEGFMTTARVPAGEVLVRQGSRNRQFVLVEDGILRVTRDGRQVADLGPGQFVGEQSLLDDGTANATVTTLTDAVVRVSTSVELDALLHSAVGRAIIETAAARPAAETEHAARQRGWTRRTSKSRPRRPAAPVIGTAMCPHTPPCPSSSAPDAAAARIVAEHLQDCGYALLCNGLVLLEGDGLLELPQAGPVAA